ncbi:MULTISPECIES: LPFR motif small protein [unclassified Streptomyces]|nr:MULTISPECIES: LPFR motif small protein [unclassified Streptomyces]
MLKAIGDVFRQIGGAVATVVTLPRRKAPLPGAYP